MDYQNITGIDKHNLDEEAVQVPGWYSSVAEKEAKATDKWEALKDQMSICKADVNLFIRGWDLNKINLFFGLEVTKITESVYANLVYLHPMILDLYNQIAQARHEALLYRAAVKSFDKKADMLKELSKLCSQGYYMKIEGQAYKLPKVNLLVEKLKEQTAQRIKREDAGKVSAPDAARDALGAKFADAEKEAKVVPAKTPKTPKTDNSKSVGRVKA